MNEQSIRQSINLYGYAPVAIDLETADLANTIEAYQNFLELPDEYQTATVFDLTDRGDGDFGQFQRVAGVQSSRGLRADNKDIFHFGSMSRQVVEARLAGPLPVDLRDLLDRTEAVFWTAQRAKRQAIEALDVAGGGLLRVMQPERGTLNDVLRLIAYHQNDDGLAQGHFDRSATTLAIGESHPGLRMAPAQNGLRVDATAEYMAGVESRLADVDHKSGEAKFFLGAGWNRLPSELRAGNEDLRLAFHDVINTGRQVGQRIMRWAVVMFSNPGLEFTDYQLPGQPETRPYKQLGWLT